MLGKKLFTYLDRIDFPFYFFVLFLNLTEQSNPAIIILVSIIHIVICMNLLFPIAKDISENIDDCTGSDLTPLRLFLSLQPQLVI